MATTNDEPKLAGDPDAQQADPEDSFDINQDYPEAAGMVIDPTDVLSMAKAIEAGVPIGKLAEVHETALSTHTWTPGAACPMRSHNRKVGSLVGVYDLKHKDNEIVLEVASSDVAWLARCETHQADFLSRTFGPAWKARNRPWEFCSECAAIYQQRFGAKGAPKKAVRKGKKINTTTVAEPKVEASPVETFETTESLQAAGIPGTVSHETDAPAAVDPNDPEEAVWNEWSAKLAKQAPVGASIDWVSDYHYQVDLKDGRKIDLMVHKGEATFRFRDKTGHDHYTDDLPAMLAEIG